MVTDARTQHLVVDGQNLVVLFQSSIPTTTSVLNVEQHQQQLHSGQLRSAEVYSFVRFSSLARSGMACVNEKSFRCDQHVYQQTELEASTHKSAKNHTGNVFVTLTPKLLGFPGLIVEHFLSSLMILAAWVWEIVQKNRQIAVKPIPPPATAVGVGHEPYVPLLPSHTRHSVIVLWRIHQMIICLKWILSCASSVVSLQENYLTSIYIQFGQTRGPIYKKS